MASPAEKGWVAAAPQAVTDDWRLLQALGLYRLLLVTGFVALQETDTLGTLFGPYQPNLFRWTCRGYAVIALLLLLPALQRRPRLSTQVMSGFVLDGFALAILLYASGGISSGLGVLMIPAVVGVSLLLSLRLGLLAAAIAFLLVFAQEASHQYPFFKPITEYSSLGPLGLMFFVTAAAASAVARRARASEARAARVGSEFADLARLNEIVLDTMQTGVLVVDRDDIIRQGNSAGTRLLADPPAALNQPLARYSGALVQALHRWREGHAALEAAIAPMRAGGIELLPRFRRLGAWADSPVLVLLEDAARIRDQAQQIKLAALGRLSASIAHEIRNPLAAITHAGQLLAESPQLGPPEVRLLDIVQRHGARINTIVKDVLDLSRPAAEPREFLLLDWLDRVVQQYGEAHPERRVDVDGDAALWVRFDPGHLQQVLFNLLDNAWTHGGREAAPPQVSLHCRALYHRGGALEVADDGPGIPPEMAEQIFEPFQTSNAKGTGLGLYLARELCAYNQAKLSHHAGDTGGTVFRVTFVAPEALNES